MWFGMHFVLGANGIRGLQVYLHDEGNFDFYLESKMPNVSKMDVSHIKKQVFTTSQLKSLHIHVKAPCRGGASNSVVLTKKVTVKINKDWKEFNCSDDPEYSFREVKSFIDLV